MKRLFWTLVAIDSLWIVLHVLLGSRLALFHLEGERTFPAFWSGWQLFAVAFLGIAMLLLSWQSEKQERPLWLLWGGLFSYLGFDEISEIHENITYYVNQSVKMVKVFEHPTFNWLLLLSPFILLGIVFFIVFVRYWIRQRRIAGWWFASGAGCFILAITLELFGGIIYRSPIYKQFGIYIVEEFAEMLGASIFLTTLAELFRQRFASLYWRR